MPTSPALDRLRLAAALTHRLPRAQLALRCANGARVTVGRGPDDDLDPCQFRRVVIASGFPGAANLGAHLQVVSLAGWPTDLGGGLYGTRCEGHVTRWFATLLGPERARVVLGEVGGAIPDDAMDAGLGVDRELSVTVVRMTTVHPALEPQVDDVARRALATCLVDEVIEAAARDRARPRPRPSRRSTRRRDGR